MRAILIIAVVAATTLLAGPTVAGDVETEPTEPLLGPPTVYEDPVGDVPEGAPDLISCSVSEPWESLVRFELEFASQPQLAYDLETWTTDELWVTVSTRPDPVFPDDVEYALIVHGATLAEVAESGSGLYDATAAEGDEVFWGVVDVDVDGPTLRLSVDRKLLGDPDVLYFSALATSEEADESGEYESCPDEEVGAGRYVLVGS